jgi:hypothetical protein
VSRLLGKIDHFEGCFYVIQSFLQGMDHICSGYFDVSGSGHVHFPSMGRAGGKP